MPHLNYYLDYTVSVFVVHRERVLLVDHKQLEKWLPLGGHIETGEDPEQAAHREVAEESGLEIEIYGERPSGEFPGTRLLVAPTYLDVHHIAGEHHHLGMIYFARSKTDAVTLARDEHNGIRWFPEDELHDGGFEIPESVRFYGREALRRVGAGNHPSAGFHPPSRQT
jgi:ADP-ribose pyrophosphatase YjhB (NUDIX family)